MDPIVGVWLTSILGAAGFSAAGYVLGQRGVVLPLLGLPPKEVDPSEGDRPTPDLSKEDPPTEPTETKQNRASGELAAELRRATVKEVEGSTPVVARISPEDDEEGDEETFVADSVKLSGPASGKLPPPSLPPKRAETDASAQELRVARAELALVKSALQEANERAEKALAEGNAAAVARTELQRQLDTIRAEQKQEAVARATAERTVEELNDRLARASEEAASLRHRAATAEKQAKQLRDAASVQTPSRPPPNDAQRRRELEEAEEVRAKLRDVYAKLERSTLPPAARRATPAPPAVAERHAEDSVLRQEIVRLTSENRTLRARALGSGGAKAVPARTGSVPEVDLEPYRTLVGRLNGITGVGGAIVGDDLGSLLIGSGELAESMAAFGAYIRDAGGRTEGLLPLEGVEQVAIRDRGGFLLTTRVLAQPPSELLLVLLGSGDAMAAAERALAESLGSR